MGSPVWLFSIGVKHRCNSSEWDFSWRASKHSCTKFPYLDFFFFLLWSCFSSCHFFNVLSSSSLNKTLVIGTLSEHECTYIWLVWYLMMNQHIKLCLWFAFPSNTSAPLSMFTSWATSSCPLWATLYNTIHDSMITMAVFMPFLDFFQWKSAFLASIFSVSNSCLLHLPRAKAWQLPLSYVWYRISLYTSSYMPLSDTWFTLSATCFSISVDTSSKGL